MRINHKHTHTLFIAILAGLIILVCSNQVIAAEKSPLNKGSFLFLGESMCYDESFGMLMVCPAHNYATVTETLEKLQQMLQNKSTDRLSSIWVCRASQLSTLKTFAPKVDLIFINPFAVTSTKDPKQDDIVWPGYDNPFINQIRQIRDIVGNKILIGCINLNGEPGYFNKRKASFEEIKWMVYALVGANFQGVTWRSSFIQPNRIRQLESNVQQYTDDIGIARPVEWVRNSGEHPVSAICSKKLLFVVLLNPKFMAKSNKKKMIPLPLDSLECTGEVSLMPPNGVTVLSGNTVTGRKLLLDNSKKDCIRVYYSFKGSGELLVFHLAGNASVTSDIKKKREMEPDKGKTQ